VINLDNGAYRLTGSDDPVMFDIAAEGRARRIGWTAANAAMAFLAMDRNGNGVIDDGSELFGNHTMLANGMVAREGFEALAELDSNHDGVVDRNDSTWTRLLLWIDWNHDGVSQGSEIQAIANSDVSALGYEHHFTGRRDPYGNFFRWEANLGKGQGSGRPYYDIYFAGTTP
jgi:hypothetical protein